MPKPFRILYVCHDGDLYGSQQSLLLLLENLSPTTYIRIVSMARKGPLQERLAQIPHVQVLSHQRLQWVKHDRRSGWQRIGDLLGLGLALLPRSLALAAQIRRHQIQCVHTNSMVSLEGALAARIAGVPHCWHIRELFMEENPKLHMVLGRKLTRWIIHQLSQRVICISNAVQQQFQPYLCPDQKQKYPILYNALALQEAPAKVSALPNDTVWRIGYIGRLSAGKRFQDLLEAFSLLKQTTNHPMELWVAGNFVDEAFQKQILERIQTLQLQNTVHLLGYQQDLTEVYNQLNLLVLPSLNEPFGRVLIEAMRAGIPCIGANSGGIPEIITHGETGFLYPPQDPVVLSKLLKELLTQPERLAQVRENAIQMLRERFSIDTQIKALDQIYTALCRQPQIPLE